MFPQRSVPPNLNAFGVYRNLSGLGAAVVAVPANHYINTISAYCSAPGASVQIGALPAVPIPAGGSLTIDVGCGVYGVVNVTFVGTDGYLIDTWYIA